MTPTTTQAVTNFVERGAPPSSYAILAVYERESGAWLRVFAMTALRSTFIAPGLLVAGLRGKQLLLGSVLASTSITLCLFAYYGIRRAGGSSLVTQIEGTH